MGKGTVERILDFSFNEPVDMSVEKGESSGYDELNGSIVVDHFHCLYLSKCMVFNVNYS